MYICLILQLTHLRQRLNVSATAVLGSFTERLIQQQAQPMDVSYSQTVPRDEVSMILVQKDFPMELKSLK